MKFYHVCEGRKLTAVAGSLRPFILFREEMRVNRKRSLWISMTAALLSCLLVYGVYVLLIRQVELQKTVNVVAPKDFIKAGTLITADMVEYKPIYAGDIDKQMVLHAEDIVGKEALVPLGSKEPVLEWKVDRFHLLPGAHQATFQIPKEYILSLPGGIRAGDQVLVYVSGKPGGGRLLPDAITVASVKSSGNVEVDDPKQPNLLSKLNGDAEKMYAARREANGAIDQISLNLTEEQWLTIDETCRSKQAKLVIAFTSSSITGK